MNNATQRASIRCGVTYMTEQGPVTVLRRPTDDGWVEVRTKDLAGRKCKAQIPVTLIGEVVQ